MARARAFFLYDVLKIGQPFMLELIWEDSVPVLKFCSKVKVETICD